MSNNRGISDLLQDLQALYYRLCALDLRKRMNLYHRNTGAREVPDVSTSLSRHLDKLASTSKPNTAATASTTKRIASRKPAGTDKVQQPGRQTQWLSKAVHAFIRPKKIYSAINTSDKYMGEKLKESTWTHIHTAMLQARQGDAINAKLHAEIASNALKEAAKYLTEEDYKALCEEVAKEFKKLEE
jgi:hypothetical protein